MDYEQQFFVERIDMETILSLKFQLKQQQLLEPVLIANLDYAARILTCTPTAMLSGVTLCIAGESVLVKILPQNDKSGLDYCQSPAQPYQRDIHFTVISNDGQPQLIRRVVCGDVITDSDIQDVHFSGHNCQDMVTSCSQQARELVSQGNKQGITALHIFCNSLSLTYSIGTEDGQSVVSQSPQTKQQSVFKSYVLKTQCRIKFNQVGQFRELLKIKCWLEQEKPQKGGLIACMDHLLKKLTELSVINHCHWNFILQSDGEVVELLNSNSFASDCYIFGDTKGVTSYPAQLER